MFVFVFVAGWVGGGDNKMILIYSVSHLGPLDPLGQVPSALAGYRVYLHSDIDLRSLLPCLT